jgi:hypothetical protein
MGNCRDDTEFQAMVMGTPLETAGLQPMMIGCSWTVTVVKRTTFSAFVVVGDLEVNTSFCDVVSSLKWVLLANKFIWVSMTLKYASWLKAATFMVEASLWCVVGLLLVSQQ